MDVQIYRKFFKGKQFLIFGLIIIIGIGVLLNGISSYVFGKIIDAITAFSSGKFKWLLLIYLVIFLATQALNIIETLLGTYVVNKIQNEMQQTLMNRILTLKCYKSDDEPEGEF